MEDKQGEGEQPYQRQTNRAPSQQCIFSLFKERMKLGFAAAYEREFSSQVNTDLVFICVFFILFMPFLVFTQRVKDGRVGERGVGDGWDLRAGGGGGLTGQWGPRWTSH